MASTSTSGVTFSGAGSGIDYESIITKLMQLENVSVTRLQTQQAQLSYQQNVYAQLRSGLQSFNSSASTLSVASAYAPVTASSSNTDVASVSVGTGATAGIYNLTVSKLAQAQKISSAPQTDTVNALNYSGTFIINGKALEVKPSDTLTTIAQSINAADAGVVASLIDGGTGSAYLTLTAKNSGVASKIQLANVSGDMLGSLGLASGTAVVRDTGSDNQARSIGFTDGTSAVGTLLGASFSGSFTIDGAAVAVDLSSDSLQSIATKINALGNGTTASVLSFQKDGKTLQRLEIASAAKTTPTFTDANGILESIGILQKPTTHELISAQDASYTIDSIPMTSSSNTISSTIPGVTVTLLKANATTPETATLTLANDTNTVKSTFKSFMSSYNDLRTFINSNSTFDAKTFESGPLFADSTAEQIQSTLSDSLFVNVSGSSYQNLTQIGFGLDKDGMLTLDETALDSALSKDPESVRKLMMATGSASNPGVEYVSGTTKTASSGTSGYLVDISRIATKGTQVSNVAQTTASTGTETLTFGGALFGNTNYNLNVNPLSTIDTLVKSINSDYKLKDLVTASVVDGKLNVVSKRYGANGNFTLVSDLDAGPDNSGIGKTGGVVTDGVDVTGTINGEAATGSGQYLTGNEGNTTTSGLQIKYDGLTTGPQGTVSFNRGIAALMNYRVDTFTDVVNGTLTATDKTIQSKIDDLTTRIADTQDRLKAKEDLLRSQYIAMDKAVAAMQQQMSQLTALTASSSSNG